MSDLHPVFLSPLTDAERAEEAAVDAYLADIEAAADEAWMDDLDAYERGLGWD